MQSAISGYSGQGNLFSGTGYWAQQTDMPTTLTDHIVRRLRTLHSPAPVANWNVRCASQGLEVHCKITAFPSCCSRETCHRLRACHRLEPISLRDIDRLSDRGHR